MLAVVHEVGTIGLTFMVDECSMRRRIHANMLTNAEDSILSHQKMDPLI